MGGKDKRENQEWTVIDLISTREDIEEETRTAAHLLAGIIAMAIEDLCIDPTIDEIQNSCNLNKNAISSLTFFFNPRSAFIAYANLIGIDPQIFLIALKSRSYENESQRANKIPYLSCNQINAIKLRVYWWLSSPLQSRQMSLEL